MRSYRAATVDSIVVLREPQAAARATAGGAMLLRVGESCRLTTQRDQTIVRARRS